MDAHEVIDGDAVEMGTDMERHHGPPPTLFRTADPVEVLERASRVADALKGVIVQQQLYKVINGKPHVFVEAWATCGAMLGLTAYVVWSKPVGERGEHGYDWEARVEVRTLDGRTIAAAEAMCARKESKWKTRDDYALRSMAQTRATSKAFRGPLGFIVTLAGYSATPAEEMPDLAGEPQTTTPGRRDVERTGESDIPSDTAPAKIGESGAALILGRAKDAGIDRDRVRKAAWHAAGQPPDGHLSVEGSFDADQVAIAMLSQFTEDGKTRLLKWIAKAEQAAKGETS